MNEDFEKLWKLKPLDKSRVLVYNKEAKVHAGKTIYRYYRTYLNQPPHDTSVEKSIMFDQLESKVLEII